MWFKTLPIILLMILPTVMLPAERPEWTRREVMALVRTELRGVEHAAGLFVRGEMAEFHQYFSPEVHRIYPEEHLRHFQEYIMRRYGNHRHTQAAYAVASPAGLSTRGAIVPVDMEAGNFDLHIGWRGGFGPESITYFRIGERRTRPSHDTAPTRPQEMGAPPYVYHDLFEETEINIPRDDLEPVTGKLAIPVGSSPSERFPAVLLIGELHASGFDSARGMVRPRRDLALGLACQGIVTLRIDTRNPMIEGWNIESHYLTDLREALRLLYNHPRVDRERLYIAGHEVGGVMAAALAREIRLLRGAILLGTPDHWTPGRELQRATQWLEDMGPEGASILSNLRGEYTLRNEGNLPDNHIWNGYPWHFWDSLSRRDAIALLSGYPNRVLYIHPRGSHLIEHQEPTRWRRLLDVLADGKAVGLDVGYWLTPIAEEMEPPRPIRRNQHVDLRVIDLIVEWIGEDSP